MGRVNGGGYGRQEPQPQGVPVAEREPDALYQFDRFGRMQRVGARVLEPAVDEAAQEVRFGEIYKTDDPVLADECGFRNYKIRIKRIAYAAKVDKEAPHKGRVLRDVTAKLLGYREP